MQNTLYNLDKNNILQEFSQNFDSELLRYENLNPFFVAKDKENIINDDTKEDISNENTKKDKTKKEEKGADEISPPKKSRGRKKTISPSSENDSSFSNGMGGDDDGNDDSSDNNNAKKVKRPRRAKQKQEAILSKDLSEEELLAQIPQVLPVIPLENTVIFNSMVAPLYVSKENIILAIENASIQSKFVYLVATKEDKEEHTDFDSLHDMGTVGMILRMIRTPDGQLKYLVQGVSRAIIMDNPVPNPLPFMLANICLIPDMPIKDHLKAEALMRMASEYSEKILNSRGIQTAEIMPIINQVEEPGRMADLIAANMRLNVEKSQIILECMDPVERLAMVVELLIHELDIVDIQARIQNIARESMEKAQRTYFLREQMKAIRQELGEGVDAEEELSTLREKVETYGLSKQAKEEAEKQIRRLAIMGQDSAEASVIRNYLDWLLDMPWKKSSRDILDVKKAQKTLDADHYGLNKIKDRILEFLSVRKLNPDARGTILCFVGPPGVGKTSLGRSIAHALGKKFQRISLGGMRDEAEIRGHRRTYIGAMPGRIVQALKQAGTKNPVILFDEIDKLANDFRGDPASALLEVLDPEQNVHFSDNYLNVEFDLSKVLFICTANSLDTIPSALRDRFEIIPLSGYTELEKLAIAKRYLVKRQVKENGLKESNIKFSDATLRKVINEYTREAGLRNLEREIGSICRKIARLVAQGEGEKFQVTDKKVEELLGAARFIDDFDAENHEPGIATGLAWTQAGGEVLQVEVSLMKGKGALQLTGQLGDVMKESAQAALSYARSHAEKYGIDPEFYEKYDLHVHVPAGATPKDGPSAGVTMISALISALSQKTLRADFCMTGEITLRGRVLPVGGIKEKILAAVSRGLTHVIIPKKNVKDLEDIPAELLENIEVHAVSCVEEVLELVLEGV